MLASTLSRCAALCSAARARGCVYLCIHNIHATCAGCLEIEDASFSLSPLCLPHQTHTVPTPSPPLACCPSCKQSSVTSDRARHRTPLTFLTILTLGEREGGGEDEGEREGLGRVREREREGGGRGRRRVGVERWKGHPSFLYPKPLTHQWLWCLVHADTV